MDYLPKWVRENPIKALGILGISGVVVGIAYKMFKTKNTAITETPVVGADGAYDMSDRSYTGSLEVQRFTKSPIRASDVYDPQKPDAWFV